MKYAGDCCHLQNPYEHISPLRISSLGFQCPPPKNYLFWVPGMLVVNEKLFNLIDKYNLGKGFLHEIFLYQNDKKTRMVGRYFAIIPGERIQAFNPAFPPKMHLIIKTETLGP